jgi:hypothetical protein
MMAPSHSDQDRTNDVLLGLPAPHVVDDDELEIETECPGCGGELDRSIPDPARPERILHCCLLCGAWFLGDGPGGLYLLDANVDPRPDR